MSENEKQTDPELEKEQREIRQRLIVRVAIAVGLIGAAAVSLPLLDKLKSSTPEVSIAPPPASDEKTTRIIGAPTKTDEKPAEPAAPIAKEAEKTPEPDTGKVAPSEPSQPVAPTKEHDPEAAPAKSTAAPAKSAPAPAAEPKTPPAPVVATQPKLGPVTTLPNKPLPPESPPPKSPPPAAVVAPSKPLAPLTPLPNDTAPAKAPQVESAPAVPRSKMGANGGYTVQLGVFSNYDNAKALQQKLAAAGIQAHLETRVHLGPFKDKQEADEAYRKIKQMGLPAVLVGQ